jgi:hypothetical protein
LRWEYYVGGMFGLVLGFVLQVGNQPEDLVSKAITAGMRSVVWFAAFALLENLAWTARGRALALTAGVAALLLNLSVSGGIGFPSVAGPLWAAAALALAAVGHPPSASLPTPSAASRLLPLPVFAALALAYLVYVFSPVTSGAAMRLKGEETGRAFLDRITKNEGATFLGPLARFKKAVIGPLDEAVQDDPDDARNYAARATWKGHLWRLELLAGVDHVQARPVADEAVADAVRAQQLDPESPRGYLAEYGLRLSFAQMLEQVAKKQAGTPRGRELAALADDQYRLAAAVLTRYQPHDPTNPTVGYQIASALMKAGDKGPGRAEAAATLALDDRLSRPTRRLTDPQRKELRRWIEGRPAG